MRREQQGPKGNILIPILLVCLVALLAGGCAGATYLATKVDAGSRAQPVVEPETEPRAQLEVAEAETSVVADDVVMTLNGDRDTIVLAGEDYLEAGCHAVQIGVGYLTDEVEISGEVDSSVPGDYVVNYKVTTEDGRCAEASRTVHVVDDMSAAADVPVLMYHWVYTAENVPDDLNGNYILDTDLEQQLQYLNENDFYYPSYEELRGFVDGTHTLPEKSVIITFDDGEWGFLDIGIPLLNEYEVPATSFLICKDDDAWMKATSYASKYVRFQSHSYGMHEPGSGVGRGGILHAMTEQEIYDDCMKAEEVLGDVEAMAYPFGDNNETAWAAMEEAGILCAFTVVNGRVSPGENPYALDRVRISGEYSLSSFESLLS